MPTYSPDTEADISFPRPYRRLTNQEITPHLWNNTGRVKPWVYLDAIDSILNIRPDIHLVVADGKSTDSIRSAISYHREINENQYTLELYQDKLSQWAIFNDVYHKYATSETKYFVYTSSDVIWRMDWVAEAIKEFENNPKLQILFPTVNNGDGNLPCQVEQGPKDQDPILPPVQEEARAPCLNAYAMIFRIDFLKRYNGYPDIFRNCYTESFLHYLCVAMGGEMRLMPRGWCFHWGTVDIWQENGSYYYYNEEKTLFQEIMNKVQMVQGMGALSPELLRKLLWK